MQRLLVQPAPAPCPATVGPNDADEVLRVSSGIVGYKVSGLDPDDPDADGPDPGTEPDNVFVAASDRACARYAAGETCVDDIGLFVAEDLGL